MNKTNEMLDELQDKFNLNFAEAENALDWLSNKDDLDSDVEEKLYSFYMDSGEMPYGTAKARDGDPQLWIRRQLLELFK